MEIMTSLRSSEAPWITRLWRTWGSEEQLRSSERVRAKDLRQPLENRNKFNHHQEERTRLDL